MDKRTTSKPFFLLDNVQGLHDDLFQCLLGMAVHKAYDPIGRDHVPRPPYALKACDAIDELYPPKAVDIRDVKLVTKATRSKRASVKLERLISGAFGSETAGNQTIQARAARRITMRNAPETIRTLLRAPSSTPALADSNKATDDAAAPAASGWWAWLTYPYVLAKSLVVGAVAAVETHQLNEQLRVRAAYRQAVLKLLRQHERIGIVIGFLTFIDMSKAENARKQRSATVGAGTGTHETTGTPFEAYGEGAVLSSRDVGAQGTYVGEMLFACSYLPLTYHPRPKSRWSPRAWLAAAHDDLDFDDAEVEVGEEGIWHLGDEPMKGNYAAPLGAESGHDDSNDDGGQSLGFVLLHPDDRLGENTADSESSESDSDSD